MPETFIARRWNTEMRNYVDSNNNELPKNQPFTQPEAGQYISTALQPPPDGSSPFLALPPELRLQIYTHLTTDDINNIDEFKKTFDITRSSYSSPSKSYAYLYRSPGRMTKPNVPSKQIVPLFHVCRLMRNELLDSLFGDRTFVLEASLYQDTAAGLSVLPSSVGPTAWVKRLLLITIVELDGRTKGLTNLRSLQQMVNLSDLRIVFATRKGCAGSTQPTANGEERKDDPIKAVMQCVPSAARVRIEDPREMRDELVTHFGCGMEHLFDGSEHETLAVESIVKDKDALTADGGKLSGSQIDHSQCDHSCVEGLECLNSQLRLPFSRTSGSSAGISSVNTSGEDDDQEGLPQIGMNDGRGNMNTPWFSKLPWRP